MGNCCNGCTAGDADGLDKSDAETVATFLLKDPRWRVRAVERIDLTSASWCERRRSVHVKALESFLPPEFVGGRKSARLYVPIGNFPKGPLLDFSVNVAGQQAFLLPRNEHALIHVEYVKLLAAEAGIVMDGSLEPLLAGVFGFASNPWEVFLQSELNPSKSVINRLLCKYFKKNGLPGWGEGSIEIDVVEAWTSAVDPIRKLVRERTPGNVLSAAENPLLVLPHLESPALSDSQAVVDLLSNLNEFLTVVWTEAVSPIAPDVAQKAAKGLLEFYAASGNHWSAIAECTVPLTEPFMIKTSERRGLGLNSGGMTSKKVSKQLVTFKDAYSNHVSVRVLDTNVELVSPHAAVLDEKRNPIDLTPDYKRATPELLSFYDADPHRPARIWLNLPLQASLPTRVGRLVILTLTVTALVAFCFFVFNWLGVGGSRAMTGADIAVILVPSAIAASLLIVREVSTLSTEINKGWTLATGGVLLTLWLSTLSAYGLSAINWGK